MRVEFELNDGRKLRLVIGQSIDGEWVGLSILDKGVETAIFGKEID